MTQLEAFSLIGDQITRDLVANLVPPAQQKAMHKALVILDRTVTRRLIAANKRAKNDRLMRGL